MLVAGRLVGEGQPLAIGAAGTLATDTLALVLGALLAFALTGTLASLSVVGLGAFTGALAFLAFAFTSAVLSLVVILVGFHRRIDRDAGLVLLARLLGLPVVAVAVLLTVTHGGVVQAVDLNLLEQLVAV